jgi:hypothetical protein
MTIFSDRFGGTQIQPSDVAYREFDADVNQLTQWPPYATVDNVLAKIMNVNPLHAGIEIWLPDAREAAPGETVIFYNNSAFTYFVATNTGTPTVTVEPGARRIIVLADNTTQAGSWISTLLGVGTGTLDIAGAAGAGLQAVGLRLNVAFPVITVPSARAIAEADRDHVIVWTGGTGALTLPPAGTLADFNVEIRNQGTGALTLQPTGGQTIDGVSNIVLNVDESLWLHSASTLNFWTTIGRGRNTQFAFTQLQKTVTGGTVVLTLTEAANVVQTYIGALTSNVEVIFPSIVQVYYVSNQTTGAFDLKFRNAGAGSTVSLPQGQNAILFSDGVNVINAATTLSGVAQVAYGAGTVTAPSVSINGNNNGFFSPSSGAVSFTSSGTETVAMTGAGLFVLGTSATPVLGVRATGGDALIAAERPAGANAGLALRTASSPRWLLAVNSAPETGANAGSDFQINRYSDAGALIDAVVSMSRSTGVITFNTPVRLRADVGELKYFIGLPVARPGYLYLDGALVSRAAYPDLWAYAQANGVVSEADWNAGYWGRFSVGDGASNFRLPDLRAVFLRAFDNGRGIDSGRVWGFYQDQANVAHNHGVTDGGHNHYVNDPSHAHNIADGGHGHSAWTDVQGWHGHGVSDPGHAHGDASAVNQWGLRNENWATFWITQAAQGRGGTAGSGVGIGIAGDGNHSHNVGIGTSGTGIGIYGAGTGIYLSASGTGISIQNQGAADGHPRNQAYPLYVRY